MSLGQLSIVCFVIAIAMQFGGLASGSKFNLVPLILGAALAAIVLGKLVIRRLGAGAGLVENENIVALVLAGTSLVVFLCWLAIFLLFDSASGPQYKLYIKLFAIIPLAIAGTTLAGIGLWRHGIKIWVRAVCLLTAVPHGFLLFWICILSPFLFE